MRFIYKYRVVVTLVATGFLFAAIFFAVTSPEESRAPRRVPFVLPKEDRDWIHEHPVITVGVDLDFAPIEQLDKNGKYTGVTADFLSLITRETGLQFHIDTTHTWDQSLARIREGKTHMLGAAVPSPQRRKYMDFSLPYAWLSGVIIVKKTVTEPMTLEKLRGMKVAVVRNYIWKDILEQSRPYLELSPSPDIESALKKVSFGMADAMVEYMATASFHIERLGISNLKISGDTVSVVDISFAVSKSMPQLTRILNHVLGQTSEARKKSILRQWISLEFSDAHRFKWLNRILLPAAALIALGLVAIIIWNQSLQRQVTQRTEKLNRELIQRTFMEKALRENEEKYRSIFNNIQNVYFEMRPLGKVLEISPSVEKVFGYKRETLLHQSLSRIFATDDGFRTMRTRAVKESRLNDHETLLVRPDGRRVNGSMTTTLVLDDEGNPAKIIGSIRDITERVKAQEALKASYNELEQRVRERTAELRYTNRALNQAKEAADAATRAKSNFLANMSHEIRTPLSGVISASELVMKENLPKGAAKYINIIRTSAHALLNIIDDILDFSKIEAGKLSLEHHPFDLSKLLSRSTDLFVHRFMEKNIQFKQDIPDDIPVYLKGDSFRIQQVLTNLLNNAVKFTDPGGHIFLGLSWSKAGTDGRKADIRFLVEDSGIGISPEHQAVLFSPFSQEDASTTRKYGGSGLGLSICRQLVEAMKGRIQVESEPGRGSRFTFTLPLEIRREKAVPPSKPALPAGEFRPRLQGKRILVVEDTPTNQEIALAVLDLVGAQTVLADTGEKAVAAVAAQSDQSDQSFHAVLMDLQMPEMDGFEAARAIRQLDRGKTLPIIAMTAHALKGDEANCRAAGMNDYITKPISQEKLFTALIRHISDAEKASRDEASLKDGDLPVLPDELPGMDIGRTMTALGVSSAVFLKILSTFRRDTPALINAMESAWEGGERDEVIRLSHCLKGSASGIGATTVHRLAQGMETVCRNQTALPDMAANGFPDLTRAVQEVLSTIDTLVRETKRWEPKRRETAGAPSGATDTAKVLDILDKLERALEFPELTELDTLINALGKIAGHPKITLLSEQIRSHDHELARIGVQELQTIYGR